MVTRAAISFGVYQFVMIRMIPGYEEASAGWTVNISADEAVRTKRR